MTDLAVPAPGQARAAVIAGVACYCLWGLLPIYLRAAVNAGPTPLEVVAHRALWSVPCAGALVLIAGQRSHALAVLKDPKTLAWLGLSAALIGINWLLFIWAVAGGNALEGSLGYFINPLMNMAVGAIFFRERLDGFGKTAIGFAALGVAVQTAALGHLPLMSLGIALTFTAYGLIRRQVAADAQTGLFIESLILVAPAVAYVIWLQRNGAGHFLSTPSATGLLMLGGPITVGGLALFAWAARRLPLSSIGFLQFIAPSLQFIFGVETGEHLTPLGLGSFAFIWIGAGLFVIGAWRAARRARRPA